MSQPSLKRSRACSRGRSASAGVGAGGGSSSGSAGGGPGSGPRGRGGGGGGGGGRGPRLGRGGGGIGQDRLGLGLRLRRGRLGRDGLRLDGAERVLGARGDRLGGGRGLGLRPGSRLRLRGGLGGAVVIEEATFLVPGQLALDLGPRRILHRGLRVAELHVIARDGSAVEGSEARVRPEQPGPDGGPCRVTALAVQVELLQRADLVAVGVDDSTALPTLDVLQRRHESRSSLSVSGRRRPDRRPGAASLHSAGFYGRTADHVPDGVLARRLALRPSTTIAAPRACGRKEEDRWRGWLRARAVW